MQALIIALPLLLGIWPNLVYADPVLTGKTSSQVTGYVINPNKLLVTDEKGGWYDQGLVMEQLGGWNTPYEVSAPLRIVSTSGVFQVRMDSQLVLQNQNNAQQQFRDMTVKIGLDGEEMQTLIPTNNVIFHNPPALVEHEDSIGFYTLAISGYPPLGNFQSVTGIYSGVLSLTFEPIVKEK